MSNVDTKATPAIRSVEDLTLALGLGEKFKYVYFWGHNGEGVGAHCLSQWYSSEFYENKLLFKTAEHYMMYRKALLFADNEIATKIIQADNPGKTKSLGREIKRFDENVWIAKRFEIVVEGNVLKFGSTPKLLTYLINTDPRVLVEASPQDKIWGIGMDKNAAQSQNPFNWKGSNLLGFALMEARSRLIAPTA